MRINLHADDLGVTRGINSNILEAWHAGALDSVSIVANGDAFHDAVSEINSDINRKLRLVVHLNLIDGKPIAEPTKVNILVDDQGQFRYGFLGLWILWCLSSQQLRIQIANQVEIEWREQIKRVLKAFSTRSVTAVDSHGHIHMLPFLFPIAAKLAREFSLPEIRISQENFYFRLKGSISVSFATGVVKNVLLNLLARRARRMIKKYGLSCPDAVLGILYSSRMTYDTVLSGLDAARCRQLNWLEIIFHPGRATHEEAKRCWPGKPALAKFHMDPNRNVERDALISIGATLINRIL